MSARETLEEVITELCSVITEEHGAVASLITLPGDTLRRGGEEIVAEVLRASALSVACRDGGRPTSRQGRWHNRTFVAHATKVGLEWPGGNADSETGFRGVVLSPGTRDGYEPIINRLDDAWSRLDVPHPGITVVGGVAHPTTVLRERVSGPPRPRNYTRMTCGCTPARIIRMAAGVAARGAVLCALCGERFVSSFSDEGEGSQGATQGAEREMTREWEER